jgi:hypothetical protein
VLREAIGRAFGLDPDRIICGAGSDEILNLLAHTYLSHGDEAISTTHGFLVYPIATMANGAKQRGRARKEFHRRRRCDPQTGEPRTKLVWLANPEQSDRDLFAVRRGQAAARRNCRRMCCWCSTPPIPTTCAQRLRDRHRTGGDHRNTS